MPHRSARSHLVAGALLFGLLASACAWQPASLGPRPASVAQSSKILASDGSVLTVLHAEENRESIPLDQIPRHLRDAVVAIEDERFWDHKGVDLRATLRAAWNDTSQGHVVEGGSTITQQYVKNVLLDPERTVHRKLREVVLAWQLERHTTKASILERYLNTIYFGNGAYGVQAAAGTYFGTTASRLDLAQSALLAAIIRAPGPYDPYDAPDTARARRNLVLDKMASLGWGNATDVAKAKAEPLGLSTGPADRYPAPYFVEQVKQLVLDDPRYGAGATPGARRAALFTGGLRVFTTLDLHRQAAAEDAVAKVLTQPATDPSAALVSLEPTTGYVRALVGGRDFFSGGSQAKFDLAIQGRRPAGSSFKPFVLAAALAQGVPLTQDFPAPAHIDIRLGRTSWSVSNYEDEAPPGGHMNLVDATVHSINTVYAQLIMRVGPAQAVDVARRMGVTSPLQPYPSAVLGTNDVSPLDMASAYATFAHGGVATAPVLITKVTRADGTILYESHPSQHRALPEDVADRVVPVLEQVVQRGTGVNARIGRPVAGKTGTGESWRDAWFVGFTPELSTSVWVGFPQAQVSMVPPTTRIRVLGGTWPAQIWQLYSAAALADVPVTPFPQPPPAVLDVTTPTTAAHPVPNVVGMTADAAATRLEQQGFQLVSRLVPNGDYPPGYVVAQQPCAGCDAPPASTVTVDVSGGSPDQTTVPNVLGMTAPDARATLEAAGLRATVTTKREPPSSDASTRAGKVWKQRPIAGTSVAPGSPVTAWVNPSG